MTRVNDFSIFTSKWR